MPRERRNKKEILNEKLLKIEASISDFHAKLEKFEKDKESIQAQIDEINTAEKKAREMAEIKELQSILRQNNMSIGDLKKMIEEIRQ